MNAEDAASERTKIKKEMNYRPRTSNPDWTSSEA